jgi:hypothetical protein
MEYCDATDGVFREETKIIRHLYERLVRQEIFIGVSTGLLITATMCTPVRAPLPSPIAVFC